MTIFGAGWFGTRTPLRGISGKTLQVLDPLTDLPIATVGPVQSNALGLYDQFETVPDVQHVVLTDGRHRQSATAIGAALSDPGTYAKAGELSALADRVEQVASDSGTSGLPTRPTAIPGVLKIETVKKP